MTTTPSTPGEPPADRSDQPIAEQPAGGIGDPVRERRARIAHWTLLANRVGYLILALAVALFVIAFVVGFSSGMAAVVVGCLLVSFALLAPSIVLGYAVKAAERDDAERGL